METDNSNIQCTIGVTLQEECHQKIFCRKTVLTALADLSNEDKELLYWRCEHSFSDVEHGTICDHHMKMYISHYGSQQKKCADPFLVHRKHVKSKCCYILCHVLHAV